MSPALLRDGHNEKLVEYWKLTELGMSAKSIKKLSTEGFKINASGALRVIAATENEADSLTLVGRIIKASKTATGSGPRTGVETVTKKKKNKKRGRPAGKSSNTTTSTTTTTAAVVPDCVTVITRQRTRTDKS